MKQSEIKKLAKKIAEFSATYDPRNEQWYGDDTGLGDLQTVIENELEKFYLKIIKK